MAGEQASATNQLGMIPFGSLIGNPLNAAVDAQATAAMTTLNFITKLTESKDNSNDVPNITFTYKNGDQISSLEVPLLTIVPIPYLRIDNMNIGFKANISASTQETNTDKFSVNTDTSLKASASYWVAKAEFSAAVSTKKDSASTRDSKYSVEYTIDINVHAVQDDMPAGLAKVLNILTDSISTSSKTAGGTGGGSSASGGTGGGSAAKSK